MARFAILGATGHVGFSLAHALAHRGEHELFLFARRPEHLSQLTGDWAPDRGLHVAPLTDFPAGEYDAVVNCVGAGDSDHIKNLGAELMRITECFDEEILRHLDGRPDTLYAFVSSGMVYGPSCDAPVAEGSPSVYYPNRPAEGSCYSLSKLNAEVKHRAMKDRNIVDLRLFGYVSRFLDPSGAFFLSQLVTAANRGETLRVMPSNMVRDFVGPAELLQLVERCLAARPLNSGFDVYSREPVTKFALLEHFAERHGLKWEVRGDVPLASAAVEKDCYFSEHHAAAEIGYVPSRTALAAVLEELAPALTQTAARPGAQEAAP